MPRYEFPVWSGRGPQKVAAGRGWDEKVFEWNNETNGPGAEIGTVDLSHSGEAPVRVTARFQFRNRKEVTYEGPVPGGDTWEGESTLRHAGGDPEFPRNLKVLCWNPKRWG